MLVISSDDQPIYNEHRKVWRSYMNNHPIFESYFIQNRDGPQELEGDTFWLTGKESISAVLKKTLDSFDFFLKKDRYDFIVRTNLSSLWNFKALLKHLENLPRSGVYNGVLLNHSSIPFVSGAGFILTPDIATLLVENREIVESYNIIDDVDIGLTLNRLNISPTNGRRTDSISHHLFRNHQYNDNVYHYRFKLGMNPNHRRMEAFYMNKILSCINTNP